MTLRTQSVDDRHLPVFNLTGGMNADQVAKMPIGTLDPIRVLIVDGHKLVRAGIRSLVERLPDVEVVAEAGDGLEALDLVAKFEPEIVMMELELPNVNGLQATERMAELHANVKVIIVSIYSDEEHVWQALRSGAAGYLFKGASMEELEVAIRSVARGETYLSTQVSKPIIAEYLHGNSSPRLREILSTRQRQVLKLIAAGKNTKQIALKLSISVKTVESHRAQLMERLGIHDVAGLVRYAIKMGLAKID
jgi:DNA-binding NarL/FixJ family response regulator